MVVENRFRVKTVIESGIYGGAVSQTQLDSLSSSPTSLTIANNGSDSNDPVRRFVTTITCLRSQTDDTGTATIANRSTLLWHLEDTAGALFTSATLVVNGHTSGNTAVGLVLIDSTLSFISGKVLCSATGEVHIAIGTSSGDVSTARMFLTLPNGEIVSGSTLVFTT